MRVHRNGAIVVPKSKGPKPEDRNGPVIVSTSQMRKLSMELALKMAGGDNRLTLPQPDGSVTIRNNPHYVPGR